MRNLREKKLLERKRIGKILENLDILVSIEVEEMGSFDCDVVPSAGWQAIEGL